MSVSECWTESGEIILTIQIVMKCISDVLSLKEKVGLVGTVKRWPSLQAS